MTCMRGGLCPPSNFLRGDSVRGVFSGGILWGGGGLCPGGIMSVPLPVHVS